MSSIVRNAYRLADLAHVGQLYGAHPYIWHCEQVVIELERTVGVGGLLAADLCAAAWLHDALEDTTITRELIAADCGADVADLVWACTGVGINRRVRNVCIAERVKIHPRASLIKVADRIANMRECLCNAGGRWSMYLKEATDFRASVGEVALAVGGEVLVDVFDALVRGPRP